MNTELERVLPMEIEKRSFEIIESELPHPIDPALAPIIKRVIHTSADFDYADNLCFSEDVVAKAHEAIKNGACIVTDTQMAKAGINKKITLYIPEDDEEEVYTIVSTMRQDSLKGLISVESPLGKALLRHKVGDTVTVRVSADYSYQAVIRKVEDSEDAESASLRNF